MVNEITAQPHPRRARPGFDRLIYIVSTVTFAIAAWFTWQLIELQLPYRTPGSGLPNAAFTTPLLLGLVGLIVVLLKQLAEHAPAARVESGGIVSQ